jgi:SAM-dependent methyltransferase
MLGEKQVVDPPRSPPEGRHPDQVREQYRLEKELAQRLRSAGRSERAALYPRVYDELFRKLAHHPQRTRGRDRPGVASQLRFLRPYLARDTRFLEIGAGDCALAAAVAPHVRSVCALEVSSEVTRGFDPQTNLRVVHTEGIDLPLPAGSIDLAYSYQVMEHLHPDDAIAQLREIARVLAPGGAYLCITPNRLSGPHDISRHFDREATGLHLREYTVGELRRLFKQAGFLRFSVQRVARSRAISIPAMPIAAFERLLEPLPWPLRMRVARAELVARGLEIFALGRKARS